MSAQRTAPLSTGAAGLLAIVAGGAIANNYAIQPSLAEVAGDLGMQQGAISLAVSGLMLGYLAGLALLVPLVDHVNPRRLVPLQLLALALALAAASRSFSAWSLLAAFVLVGAMATVAAQTSAIVGKLALPADRGRQMGTISAGISAGILLSRFVGGLLSERFGWRMMLLCFAAFICLAAAAAWATLPDRHTKTKTEYLSALRSAPELLARVPDMRWATAAGMLWFAAFSAVWVGLAVELAQPPWSLSAQAIGFFSLAGLLGLLITPIAGRLTDRFGPQTVKLAGLGASAISLIALYFAGDKPIALMLALAVFDAGCFAAQVANQSAIVRLAPERSGALMSTYLLLYYLAGAIGTAAAGPLVTLGSWPLLIAVTELAIFGAIVLSLLGWTRRGGKT